MYNIAVSKLSTG